MTQFSSKIERVSNRRNEVIIRIVSMELKQEFDNLLKNTSIKSDNNANDKINFASL